MLITTNNLPMNKGGIPWGPIILTLVIVGGVGFISYQAIKTPKLISETKTKENEG